MATIKVNDIQVYYELHGRGEPLLLIMGLGANATAWEMQIPDFSRRFKVIAYDNRGAGRTDKPKEPYAIPQMADDAAGLLDALEIASAHVFGMSMGGMIAQEFALRHPQRLRRLVLGGTMAGGPNAVMAGPQLIQQWVSTATLPPEQAVEAGLKFLYSEQFIAENRERLVKRALDLAHLMPPIDALQRQFMAIAQFSAYGRLHQIDAPTLIITGSDDKIVPAENSRILAERIAGSRLVQIEGAGHGFLAERWQEANAAVIDFLTDGAASPGPK